MYGSFNLLFVFVFVFVFFLGEGVSVDRLPLDSKIKHRMTKHSTYKKNKFVVLRNILEGKC